MRNLKRALSLVMAMALIVGMMVVSASAVSTKDFTDKDEIQHTEAVNTMVALNVISGKEDGSYFDPTGSLTRAEMAKVVSYVMNGGVEPVVGTKLVPTYSDIKGHWAEKYIEYCTSMGIISGDGAGKFNPEGTLTAEQAAKMFLTAMGYNANVFGFTGNDWAINVGRYANEAGLYEDLGDIVPSNVISRDDACQMAYNAIQATMMKRSWNQDLQTGDITETYEPDTGKTLFSEKFNGTIYEGQLVANGEFHMSGYGAAGSDKFTVRYDYRNNVYLNTWSNITLKDGIDHMDLMGQRVKVLVGKSSDQIYGVFATGDSNVFTTTASAMSMPAANEVKVDGSTYSLDTANATYLGLQSAVSFNSVYNVNGSYDYADELTFVDFDGNNKYETILVNQIAVSTVTYAGSDSVTVGTVAGSNTTVNGTYAGVLEAYSQPVKDLTVYEGIANKDYVAITRDCYTGGNVLEKIDVVSGDITSLRSTATQTNIQIDGTWYRQADSVLPNSYGINNMKIGEAINAVVIGNVLYYAEMTSGTEGSRNLAVIINTETAGVVTGTRAKIILTSGTSTTVDLDTTGATDVGKLYTYTVNNDGSYKFYALADGTAAGGNRAGYSECKTNSTLALPAGTATDSTNVARTIADDAIVIYFENNASFGNTSANDAKVFTGKEWKSLAATPAGYAASADHSVALFDTVNGFKYAKVVLANGTADKDSLGIGAGGSYGYLVANAVQTKNADGKDIMRYVYWDGSQEVTADEVTSSDKRAYTAGTIITFDEVGNGEIKNVAVAGTTDGAITGYDNDNLQVSAASNGETVAKINSDTVTIYVDSNDTAGANSSGYPLASKKDGVNLTNNAKYIFSGSGSNAVVKLVVIDVENEMVGTGVSITGDTTIVADINAALINNSVVTVNGASTLESNLTVNNGKTVIFNGAVTGGSSTITLDGTAKVVFNAALTGTGAITVGDNSVLEINADSTSATGALTIGETTGTLRASATIKDYAGNVTVNKGDLTADALTGTLTLVAGHTAKASVESVGGNVTAGADSELTVASGTLTGSAADALAGKIFLAGNVTLANGTHLAGAATVTFNGAYKLTVTTGALDDTNMLKPAAGASVQLGAAPSASTGISFYAHGALTTPVAASSISTSSTYVYQATGCGADGSAAGWVANA